MTAWRDECVDALVEWQHEKCAICRRKFVPSRLTYLDHEHASGEVRGVLCNACNGLIGMLGEDVRWLLNAAEYLMDPPSRECWTEPRYWPGSPGAAGITIIPTKEVDNA